MGRIVISFLRDPVGAIAFTLTKGADGSPHPGTRLFQPTGDSWQTDFQNSGLNRQKLVEEAGEALHQSLSVHPQYSNVMSTAVLRSRGDGPLPIFVQLFYDELDSFPWESLRTPNPRPPEFLALDGRWPIGRIAGQNGFESTIIRQLEPEVRVLVLLAAKGISGQPQLEGLQRAFEGSQIPWKMTVLSSRQSEVDWVNGWRGRGKPVEAVLFQYRQDLLTQLNRVKPHLVHFFCHGDAASQAGPSLLLATATDEFLNMPESANVTAQTLLDNLAMENLWLLTLNCCDSAKSNGLCSLARSLVDSGLPAVVGMREKIPPADAHLFCEPLYREILRMIDAKRSGDQSDVEWVNALVGVRQELVAARAVNPADIRDWTVPVIYVRPEPFQFRKAGQLPPGINADALAGALEELKKMRASLPADTPIAALAKIDEQIRQVGNLLYS